MKQRVKLLITCIVIPLLVGGLSTIITSGKMKDFEALTQPPLSPPGILFPIVWTILYTLMGIALFLAIESGASRDEIMSAVTFFAIQLAVNFFWPIFFFGLSAFLFAFFWLVLLWVLVIITTVKFYRLDKRAGALLIPYILWLTFAGYLNFGVYVLN